MICMQDRYEDCINTIDSVTHGMYVGEYKCRGEPLRAICSTYGSRDYSLDDSVPYRRVLRTNCWYEADRTLRRLYM